MRQWPDESVDLIYLDPPFNSNANYNMLFSGDVKEAQFRAFNDTWVWDEAAADRFAMFEGAVGRPAHKAIVGLHKILGGSGMLAYLTYMAERLEHMNRLLKLSGSIYLHCDDAAVHYLKILMDAIFGADKFLNDIVWKRATSHNDSKRYGRITDHILFYAKSSDKNLRFWMVIPSLTGKAMKNYAKRILWLMRVDVTIGVKMLLGLGLPKGESQVEPGGVTKYQKREDTGLHQKNRLTHNILKPTSLKIISRLKVCTID